MTPFDPSALTVVEALCKEMPVTVLETCARLRLATTGGTLVVVGPGAIVKNQGRSAASPCRLHVEGEVLVEPRGRALVATPGGWKEQLPFGAANCQRCNSGHELIALDPRLLSPARLDSSMFEPLHLIRIIGEINPGTWTVQNDSDRRGVRLRSTSHLAGPPGLAVSRPCFIGTCQLTPDGTLIVHGPDGPTLGGYHQVGVVAEVDLSAVANLRPGDTVLVMGIDMEEALALRRKQREETEKWRRRIGLTL